MSKPIIGRFSNEQTRFIRHTNYRRSDFEYDQPQATWADVKRAAVILTIVGISIAAIKLLPL